MTDNIGKYLGLPPIGKVEEAEIVEDTPKKLSSNAKILSKALSSNIPVSDSNSSSMPKTIETRQDQADIDFDYARKNMYNVIETGTEALKDLLNIAGQAQRPDVYEALATTMKTLVNANKDLVKLSKTKAQEESNDGIQQNNVGITNNNLFVGTTHDLLKVLTGMKKDGISD